MTRYCRDISILIDFSKGREPTRTWVLTKVRSSDELGVCCVSVTEFYTGLSEAERTMWDPFLTSLFYWNVTLEAAMRAGEDRRLFSRQRLTISTTDALIAATAREVGAVLFTENLKDFSMQGIALLSLQNPR